MKLKLGVYMLTKQERRDISRKTQGRQNPNKCFERIYMEQGRKRGKYKVSEYVTVTLAKR